MTCQEAERLVTPYIRDELAGDELEAFLNHIDECPNCREELEIYFMVDVGLRQLDHDSGILFKGEPYVDVPDVSLCSQHAGRDGSDCHSPSAVSDLVLLTVKMCRETDR